MYLVYFFLSCSSCSVFSNMWSWVSGPPRQVRREGLYLYVRIVENSDIFLLSYLLILTEFPTYVLKDTAGKYRELAAKKCYQIPKPTVELQRPCILAECPTRTTPPVHQWKTPHFSYQSPPLPHTSLSSKWNSSPWSQVS